MSVMVHVYCKGGLSMVTRACVHIVDYVCGGIGQVLVRYWCLCTVMFNVYNLVMWLCDVYQEQICTELTVCDRSNCIDIVVPV